jgi:hypothetical protein
MFTTFFISKQQPKGVWKLINIFRKDKITEEYIDTGSLTVRKITYISHHKEINWDFVHRQAGYEAKSLVAGNDVRFPYGTGLIKFYDKGFMERMTENFAYGVLKEMENPEKLNIAFYDIDGSHSDFVEVLCQFAHELVVATGNKEKYGIVAEKLMVEKGVSLIITNRLSRLRNCTFVIAPSKIKKAIELNTKGVVLTSQPPCCDIKSRCYTGYQINLPEKYRRILNDGMEEMYLASCLYSKGRQHNLGSIIPNVAYNNSSTCTIKSLAKYLDKVCLT